MKAASRIRLSRGALVAVCLALAATAARADTSEQPRDYRKNSPRVLAAFRGVVARARESTVRVRCGDKNVALGTVVREDGWVVTKASELKDDPVVVLPDGREREARVVGVHEDFDLALLKVDAKGLAPAEWRDSTEDPVGNWVASAGTGEEPVAVGVVSVLARKGRPRGVPPRDAASSGYLGVGLKTGEEGAVISEVMKNSAAETAGLLANDEIRALNGKAVKDSEGFIEMVQRFKPGEAILLRVKRGDDEKDLKVTLGKRPASLLSRGDIQNHMGGDLSNRRGGFPTFLQHDTVLKPSDCGGPVVDLDGKVIGINIARAGRTESYAIPAEALQKLLPELMSGKLAPKPAEEKVGEKAK
jgi:serine protease Do